MCVRIVSRVHICGANDDLYILDDAMMWCAVWCSPICAYVHSIHVVELDISKSTHIF